MAGRIKKIYTKYKRAGFRTESSEICSFFVEILIISYKILTTVKFLEKGGVIDYNVYINMEYFRK